MSFALLFVAALCLHGAIAPRPPITFEAMRAAQLKSLLQERQKASVELQREVSTLSRALLDFHRDPQAALQTLTFGKARSECIAALAFALEHRGPWSNRMLDATAKFPAGILDGAYLWVGDFDACMNNTAPANYTGPGPAPTSHYCNVNWDIHIGSPSNPQKFPLYLGVCAPSSCSAEDVSSLAKSVIALFNSSNISPTTAYCYKDRSEIPLSTGAIVMIVICSLFALAMIIGSIFDLLWQHRLQVARTKFLKAREGIGASYNHMMEEEVEDELEPEFIEPIPSRWQKALLAFSVITNGQKILDTSQQAGRLNCLDGVRFLSMTWVILGHSYAFAEGYVNNLLPILKILTTEWTYQVLVQASVSVDSFFLLSGLLTAYFFLKEAVKMGTLASKRFWLLYFFHRYWRLTPPYMLFLGFYTTLSAYFTNGPLWSQADPIDHSLCVQNWWTNLLYINNFVKAEENCMSWSWYLSNDMQFHVFVAPIVLPLTFFAIRYPQRIYKGLAVTSVFFFVLLSMISTALIIKYDVHDINNMIQFDLVYIKPWCRVGTYAIGLATGVLILEQQKRKWRLHPALVISGWVFATGLCLSVIYGNSGVAAGLYQNSPAVNNLYNSTCRIAWGLGLAWLLFACCAGYGGPVNSLLSWSAFVPLSRLTYMAYIVHPVVMFIFYGSLRQPIIGSTILVVWFYLGHLVISYCVAFVFSLAWESPMITLERIVLGK